MCKIVMEEGDDGKIRFFSDTAEALVIVVSLPKGKYTYAPIVVDKVLVDHLIASSPRRSN